ncbi:MAG TPA: regulatory protein RecX [Panacibacter sp.]|nr:regulatory protein RecX [Panacibacter sp.]
MEIIILPSVTVKIRRFCAFQERNHQEVKEKLYGLGLYKKQVEVILAQLIEDNYLNEERFATTFARGKFRIKNWGRIKIKYELQQKRVSPYNINKALDEIDEAAYLKTLQKLANKKLILAKEGQLMIRKSKALQYLLQKGYERNLAMAAVDKAVDDHSNA